MEPRSSAEARTCRRAGAHTLLLIACTTVTADAARADTLTETDVIRLTRTRDPVALAADQAIAAARAEETRAGLYPNPTLSWDREHVPSDESTDSVFLTVPIEFVGRRPAERSLARAETERAKAGAARARSDAIVRALDAFYAALAADRAARLSAETIDRLDEAVRVIDRRHEAGTTSGYERARLEVELELARSEARLADTNARTTRTALAALLGLPSGTATLDLRGDFATHGSAAKGSAGRERASIGHLRAAEAGAGDARDRAAWAWVPELSLTGGLHARDTAGTRLGYVAGVSLALPIFSRGQEVRALASAREGLLHEEARAAERESRLGWARARELWTAARDEVSRFVDATRARVELLERAAASGYREGVRSVTELLDAQRARTAVDRRLVELEWLAKRAEIDFRAAQGEFE